MLQHLITRRSYQTQGMQDVEGLTGSKLNESPALGPLRWLPTCCCEQCCTKQPGTDLGTLDDFLRINSYREEMPSKASHTSVASDPECCSHFRLRGWARAHKKQTLGTIFTSDSRPTRRAPQLSRRKRAWGVSKTGQTESK